MKPIDRAGSVNDAYALVKAGHMAPEALIAVLGHCREKKEIVVCERLAGVLLGLNLLISGSDDDLLKQLFLFSYAIVSI